MDEGSRLIYGILLLVLVGSALFSRRIPMNQMIKMFLVWIGIFGIVFVLIEIGSNFFHDEQEDYTVSTDTIV